MSRGHACGRLPPPTPTRHAAGGCAAGGCAAGGAATEGARGGAGGGNPRGWGAAAGGPATEGARDWAGGWNPRGRGAAAGGPATRGGPALESVRLAGEGTQERHAAARRRGRSDLNRPRTPGSEGGNRC